jgi:hypothetical protein
MRKFTSVGKVIFYTGCMLLFAAGLFSIALYMEDDNGAGFAGVSSSLLWPAVVVVVVIGLLLIMFANHWGRIREKEVEVDILHFTDLLDAPAATAHASVSVHASTPEVVEVKKVDEDLEVQEEKKLPFLNEDEDEQQEVNEEPLIAAKDPEPAVAAKDEPAVAAKDKDEELESGFAD